MSGKTYILTGATGFIGSEVLKKIISSEDIAIILIRNNSDLSRLKNFDNYVSIIYDDLTNDELANSLKKYKPDVFIHLAWQGVGGSDRNEIFQITDNLELSLNSVKLANKIGCDHWIGIGSQAEYGNPNCKVSEDFPTNPTTLYGKSKLATCWATLGLCEAYKMKGSWIRVFSTYGIGDSPHWFIPYIINEIKQKRSPNLTKCEQLWDYLHVSDAAEAIISVGQVGVEGIFNIGSGGCIPLKEVVETIKKVLNSTIKINYGKVEYRVDQVMHLEADISKIKSKTLWYPKININTGINSIINPKDEI